VLDRVFLTIRTAHPGLKLRARAVVEAILLSKGSIGSAESVARALGLRNRFRLARLLQSEGLPPLHRLTEWVTVLNWIDLAESNKVSLCWMAFHSHRHPSACYRLVNKVTGHGWEEVLTKGSEWTLRQFLKELKTWEKHRSPAPRSSPRPQPPVASRRRGVSRVEVILPSFV
jgi:hypothetical protein